MIYRTLTLAQMPRVKEIVLYGAGKMAEDYIQLLSFLGFSVKMLIVSDLKNAVSEIHGIKVVELSDVEIQSEKLTIVLALSDIHHENVIKSIEMQGINCDIICLEYMEVVKTYCNSILEKHKVDLSAEFLKIGNMEIKNIFNFIEGNSLTDLLFLELPDFIFPAVWNEVGFIGEGAYEFGNVTLNDGDIVVDVGANIGLFSSLAAAKGCSKIFAFEPLQENINNLKMVSEKYANQIHIVKEALSDTEGECRFSISDENIVSIINDNTKLLDESSKLSFHATTLDAFVKKEGLTRVDFIKADIEGAERLLLKGAIETLRDFAPKIALCTYHLPDDKDVLERIILEANPNYVIEHHWRKIYAHVPQH